MKKLHTGLMSAAALLLSAAALAAPQGTTGTPGSPGGTSSSASQSGSTGSASSSMRGSASASSQLDSQDRRFIMDAASAGMFEVQAAQLAQTKAQDATAKSFAKTMLQDHQRNNQQLMQIAQSKGVTPPTKLEAKHQAMLTKLQKASGSDFDKQYGKAMDQSHAETLKLFQRAEKQVKDTELKSYIAQTLPKLEQHHQQAASLPGAEGGTSRTAEADRSGSTPREGTSSGSSSSGMGSSSDRSSTSTPGSSSSSMGGSGSGSGTGAYGGSASGSGTGSSSPGSSGSSTQRPPGSTTSSGNPDTGSTGRP